VIELFRFIEPGYPRSRRPPGVVTLGTGQTPFQERMLAAADAETMRTTAEEFLAGDGFLPDPTALRLAREYERLQARLDEMIRDGAEEVSLADVVRAVFDRPADELSSSPELDEDRSRLDDSLLALKYAPDRGAAETARYVQARRQLGLVERAAGGDERIAVADLKRALRRPLLIDGRFRMPPDAVEFPPPEPDPDDRERVDALVHRVDALQETWHALMAVQPDELRLVADGRREEQPRHRDGRPRTSTTPEIRFVATREAVAGFSETVRAALAELGVEPDATPLPEAVADVKAALVRASQELEPFLAPGPARVYRVGADFFALRDGPAAPAAPRLLGDPAPAVAGAIRPFMIGELQVVKQELIGYEAHEVSHIENVLRGEVFRRETERQELTETVTTTETERIQQEQRDLQTTDRNELRQEAQKAVTTTAEAGQSKSYGTLVENRQSQFSREITDRAVNSLTERVREQRVQREQRTFLEKTSHQVANAEGADHVRGVYQWVDKKFKTRVLNYGSRLLYDVVVPEPAAFFVAALQTARSGESVKLVKPAAPAVRVTQTGIFGGGGLTLYRELVPEDLHLGNYLGLASRYGATGSVDPPPADFQTTRAWVAAGTDTVIHQVDKIVLPPGYAAVAGFFQTTNWFVDSGNYSAGVGEVNLGPGYHFALTTLNGHVMMAGESGELPVTFGAGGMTGYNVAVGVVCKNETAYRTWQIKTYTAIMEGYRRQLAEYEERLAALQAMVQAQMLLKGNYAHDPGIERTELKKAFLHVLMSEHYAKVNMPTPDPAAFPVNLVQSQRWSSVVSFFERAIEWDNMMFSFYPYFWARPQRWGELILLQDLDPEFEAFLKAGAARVVVPARPGFEAALAHYHETGEIWLGADGPEMFGEMYLSIVDEVSARNVAAGKERCVEEWEVSLPTTLVMLRADADLPAWESKMDCPPADG
jgi:hypothetical protein